MQEFGTFDTLTDEEDRLYNRLALLRREIEYVELEQNDAQQDIKMWQNKMQDDIFSLKIWLIALVAAGIGVLPWYRVVLLFASVVDFAYAKLFSMIASFIYRVQCFILLPLLLIIALVCFVTFLINILRNSKADGIKEFAEKIGVKNRNVLIEEQRAIIAKTVKEEEKLKEEKQRIETRLKSIRLEKEREL